MSWFLSSSFLCVHRSLSSPLQQMNFSQPTQISKRIYTGDSKEKVKKKSVKLPLKNQIKEKWNSWFVKANFRTFWVMNFGCIQLGELKLMIPRTSKEWGAQRSTGLKVWLSAAALSWISFTRGDPTAAHCWDGWTKSPKYSISSMVWWAAQECRVLSTSWYCTLLTNKLSGILNTVLFKLERGVVQTSPKLEPLIKQNQRWMQQRCQHSS